MSAVVFWGAVFCAYAQTDLSAAISRRIERLQSRYGIAFKYEGFPKEMGELKFKEVSPERYSFLNDYLALFEAEISKYPPGFFRDQDIRGIGLVTALFAGQQPVQGLFSPQIRVMFFDISRFRRNKAQQRHSIHHEIFHMMVENRGGFPLLSDETWAAFNEPGFVYGIKNRPVSWPNPVNIHAPSPPGFVTYYAMESILEDQAEVFACLMQAPHRRLIEQWMQNDPALAKKVQAVRKFVEYYHSQMGEEYWQK